MPDERTEDSQAEDELMRAMAQELGEEGASESDEATSDGAPEPAQADVETAMLQMLQGAGQAEQEGGGAPREGFAGVGRGPHSSLSPRGGALGGLGGIPEENVSRLMDVKLTVSIELGRVEVSIQDIVSWTEGSLIELDKIAGEPVDVLANDKPFARGEVVVVAENFGVRITQMINE